MVTKLETFFKKIIVTYWYQISAVKFSVMSQLCVLNFEPKQQFSNFVF
jgi:hypothetical protein